MARERVLVTGGAGFIGSHLCESLAKSYEVVAVDNLSTGRAENLKGLGVELVRHDITKPLPQKVGKAELVFNLASPASPVDYRKLAVQTLLVGSIGVKNVLDYAKKNGSRVIHASTSEVYGDPLVHPQREEYWGNVNPIGERSCYDEAKRYAEALCMAYARAGLPLLIARIFNTYGPRMRLDDGRAIPNFIGQALRGEPLTIYGDGTQTRSFCYVSDTVRALERLMSSEISGEVFNIGNPDERTVLELAQLVKRIAGSNSQLIFKPLPADDPRRRRPDISKIRRMLGWEPKVKIEDGLRETIKWFKGKI